MSYRTIRESNGILQEFWGVVCSPEVFDSIRAIHDEPQFDTLQYVIKDYLVVEEFDVGVKTLVEGFVLNTVWKRMNPNIVVAGITNNPTIIATRNEALSYRFDAYPGKVFATVADARNWIAANALA